MSKYIDAEKLKAEIERRRLQNRYIDTEGYENELLEIIDSLQQEQPEEINDDEKIMNFFDALGDCGFSQHDIHLLKNIWKETGCLFPKSQVADASKMQQKVDFEKEIQEYIQHLGFGYGGWVDGLSDEDLKHIARHFYELGKNSK